MIAASTANAAAAMAEQEDMRRSLLADLEAGLADHDMHHEQWMRARDTLLPLARNRAELETASYAAGRAGLLDVIEAQTMLADIELQLLDRRPKSRAMLCGSSSPLGGTANEIRHKLARSWAWPPRRSHSRRVASAMASRIGAMSLRLEQQRKADARSSTGTIRWSRSQHFDKPGKSPFMDMELVPKYADEAASGETGVAIDPSRTQSLGLRIAEARTGMLGSSLAATGTIEFNERDIAIVQARTGGFVQRVYARAGDVIGAGARSPTYWCRNGQAHRRNIWPSGGSVMWASLARPVSACSCWACPPERSPQSSGAGDRIMW
jgi:hypothetical protein